MTLFSDNVSKRNSEKSYTIAKEVAVTFQNQLRDYGIVRSIADASTILAASSLCLFQPGLVYRFYQLSRRTKIVQYGPTKYHYLEILSSFRTIDNKNRRVVIFVHGGGWGTGQPWMYRLIAEGIGKSLGADITINVGYPMYPTASIHQQSESITAAIDFVLLNEIFSCTKNDSIILVGHSSGANVCALSLLLPLQSKVFDSCSHSRNEANKAQIPHVNLLIGLAGVYDIAKHYLHEAKRGVHQISPMQGAAGGELLFDTCSPTVIAKQLSQVKSSLLEEEIKNLPSCVLLHGTNDTVVPYTSTVEFVDALKSLLPSHKVHCTIFQSEHAAIVTDFMFNQPNSRDAVLKLCKKCID